jgi:hypothetical protein
MARQPWEIEQQPGGFRVRVIAATGVQQNPWIFVPCSAVKQVSGVYAPEIGVREPNNIRKTPIREDDRILLTISFHDENESSPIQYDILYVDNQPGWTPDLVGLQQAIDDVASWCGGSGAVLGDILVALQDIEALVQNIDTNVTNISGVTLGNTEVPTSTVNTTSGGAGNTTATVKSVSLLFEGDNGAIGGVVVDSGYQVSYTASLGNTLGSIAYTVPDTADGDFSNSPRVVIQYVV